MAVHAVADIGVKVVAAIANSKVDLLPTDCEVEFTRAGAGEQNLAGSPALAPGPMRMPWLTQLGTGLCSMPRGRLSQPRSAPGATNLP